MSNNIFMRLVVCFFLFCFSMFNFIVISAITTFVPDINFTMVWMTHDTNKFSFINLFNFLFYMTIFLFIPIRHSVLLTEISYCCRIICLVQIFILCPWTVTFHCFGGGMCIFTNTNQLSIRLFVIIMTL